MKLGCAIATAAQKPLAVTGLALCGMMFLLAPLARAVDTNRQAMVRDITTIQGVRDNALVGYGLVVGLHGTGDTQQTIFTVQTLANAMQKMGVLINPNTVVVKNVAAVFVTASLPPFARPGASEEQVLAACRIARVDEFAERRKPQGSECRQYRHHSQRSHHRAGHRGGSERIQNSLAALEQS